MKKHLLFFGLFGCGLAFGQQNQSRNTINTLSLPLAGPIAFQFDTGFIGQLQNGTSFTSLLPTDRWFSMGQVTQGGQTFYGQRFQYDGRALVTGYTSASPSNPRIEWIHSGGASAGNLEFRVANNFTNGISSIVASMTPNGNTYFARFPASLGSSNPKVGIIFKEQPGLIIFPEATVTTPNPIGISLSLPHATNIANGIQSSVTGGENSIAISGKAEAANNAYSVFGITSGNAQFSAAIYGEAPITGGTCYAGYFEGDVYSTGHYLPSDAKIKSNITPESSALEKILMLSPVSYSFNKVEGMNLPQSLQHGFISQELAEVFPELTKDITKPVIDENGKITSTLSFKAINYVGLISVLTAAVQELNTELTQVRQDLDEYKANDAVRGQIIQNTPAVNGYSIEQNVPNPFSDRTSIRFQLAPGVESATLSIFNLNGAFVRDYQLNGNAGEVEILAAEIGKGMYIYSLNQNGQEIISKRMIIK
jgi:hypothetical protein